MQIFQMKPVPIHLKKPCIAFIFKLYLQWWKGRDYRWNDENCNKVGGMSAVCEMPGILLSCSLWENVFIFKIQLETS